ncbi:hypothetical protein CDAR_618721 [Caerostris darwini]|uniref:Uncharacterized protein n=1 Tax=Caerostris darwini TaxID=1538125 RepID=A0AAV4WQ39_9ARAC|nr:hypothetical protein CDAR_618721 [Caerostris darwini]
MSPTSKTHSENSICFISESCCKQAKRLQKTQFGEITQERGTQAKYLTLRPINCSSHLCLFRFISVRKCSLCALEFIVSLYERYVLASLQSSQGSAPTLSRPVHLETTGNCALELS